MHDRLPTNSPLLAEIPCLSAEYISCPYALSSCIKLVFGTSPCLGRAPGEASHFHDMAATKYTTTSVAFAASAASAASAAAATMLLLPLLVLLLATTTFVSKPPSGKVAIYQTARG